jgi:hypothetical protein
MAKVTIDNQQKRQIFTVHDLKPGESMVVELRTVDDADGRTGIIMKTPFCPTSLFFLTAEGEFHHLSNDTVFYKSKNKVIVENAPE